MGGWNPERWRLTMLFTSSFLRARVRLAIRVKSVTNNLWVFSRGGGMYSNWEARRLATHNVQILGFVDRFSRTRGGFHMRARFNSRLRGLTIPTRVFFFFFFFFLLRTYDMIFEIPFCPRRGGEDEGRIEPSPRGKKSVPNRTYVSIPKEA